MEQPCKYDKLGNLLSKMISKHRVYKKSVLNQIQVLELALHQALESSQKGDQQAVILEGLSDTLLKKRPLSKMEESNRGFYKYISKLGKDIDKLKSCARKDLNLYDLDFDHKSLKEAIGEYLLHQVLDSPDGQTSISLKKLVKDLDLVDESALKKRFDFFMQVRVVCSALRNHQLKPLEVWLQKNSKKISLHEFSLMFKFIRLKVFHMIFEKQQSVEMVIQEILKYQKKLAKLCASSLSRLLASLIFLKEHSGKFQKDDLWRAELVRNPNNKRLLNQRFE